MGIKDAARAKEFEGLVPACSYVPHVPFYYFITFFFIKIHVFVWVSMNFCPFAVGSNLREPAVLLA